MTRPEPQPGSVPPAVTAAGLHIDAPDEWHRLSPWMMAVTVVESLPSLVPVLIALVFAGRSAPLVTLVATVVLVPLVTVVPWLTTFYQVTAEHVRVRSGLITKKVATARRDRIRSVDLTASLVHRVLNLQKVTIGTGGDEQASQVKLRAVTLPEARALHDNLMPTAGTRSPATSDVRLPSETPTAAPEVLTRFQNAWLRYSPFSLGGLAIAAAVAGVGVQIANDAGMFDEGVGLAREAFATVRSIPLTLVIAVAVVAVILIGAVLSVIGYVLSYWDFRLTRHPDGTLRTERGLLTTNSISFDEKRIRGSHLTEPILMRPLKGARLQAIATGATKHPLLLPPAPISEAMRVADLVTHERSELTAPLTGHGRVARIRRLNRGFLTGLVILVGISIPVVGGAISVGWLAVGVLCLAGSIGLGVVRSRHLGHRLTARSVVIAPPTVARQRIVVDRDGVIGWASRSSIFQRRAGVSTLILATAAGSEHYSLVDVDDATAAAITSDVTPDWVAPFLRQPAE
ncbi:PH domain-containing protein [Gordonia rubripertincta]|uniref:PH domain-containing protein n=1 Tax=Gordonia rubripertincta TaxID=36822 RepID=UPI000B8D42C7|nr:PH domain-containing protein [Gordonia rubripertincta]ASR04461.1 Bacterial membrane flanked domain protein [Gordonia rubripertincta]